MMREKPRSRLRVLTRLLGMTFSPTYVSRGGQVTKEFFLHVGGKVGVPPDLLLKKDKLGVCRTICQFMAIPFDAKSMSSRGARITNVWFDAIMHRLDRLSLLSKGGSHKLTRSTLGFRRLAAHIRADMQANCATAVSKDAPCYCCGDAVGRRLEFDLLEPHCTLPYSETMRRPPSDSDYVSVCPSCHKVLHLRGIQAKALLRELRP